MLEQVPFEYNFFLAQGLTYWEQAQVLSDCETIDFSAYTVINAIETSEKAEKAQNIHV